MDIIEFVESEKYLGDRTLSVSQRSILKAIYGLRMSGEEGAAFRAMSEGRAPRRGGYQTASLGCGRRSGKTDKIGANIVAYEAFTFDPSVLSAGETAYAILVAQNKKSANICRDYVEAKFHTLESRGWDVLSESGTQLKSVTAEEIRLSNGVVVSAFPCKKVAVRGVTGIVAVFDEVGHWQVEENAYNADIEVLRAVRPTGATIGRKFKLVKISTPFVQAGIFYEDFKSRARTRQLVLHEIPTEFLNPAVSKEFLLQEQRDDPESYRREYLARWESVHGGFIPPEIVDPCIETGRVQVPYQQGRHYLGTIDAAFKRDLFAFGIAHAEGRKVILDLVRHWKPAGPRRPLNMKSIVEETSELLRHYGMDSVMADQFADVPLSEEYGSHGMRLVERPITHAGKFEMFTNLRAVLQGKLICLPDDAAMRRDLTCLESKRMPGGLHRIQAPNLKGYHDDISIVVARLTMELLNLRGADNIYEMNQAGGGELIAEREGWQYTGRREEREDGFERDIMGAVL